MTFPKRFENPCVDFVLLLLEHHHQHHHPQRAILLLCGLSVSWRQEEEEIRDLVEVQVIQHKVYLDLLVLVVKVVTKVLLATRELLVIKDQPHLRDLREQKDR